VSDSWGGARLFCAPTGEASCRIGFSISATGRRVDYTAQLYMWLHGICKLGARDTWLLDVVSAWESFIASEAFFTENIRVSEHCKTFLVQSFFFWCLE
jgi:hypothetical protein